MLRRIFQALVVLLVLVVAGPPLFFAIFPETPPELPAPGRRVALTDGAELHVLEFGSGPPIVLSHGFPGTAYDWGQLPEALAARGFRAIPYCRKGWGRSDRRGEDEPHTLEANANELNALVRALELEDATVVGWSYGGATLIVAAAEEGTPIARSVLVATGPPDDEDTGNPSAIRRGIATWAAWVPPASRALVGALSREAFSGQPLPADWVPRTRANLTLPGTRRTMRLEGSQFRPDSIRPEAMHGPILGIFGTEDRVTPHDPGVEAIRSTRPDAKIVSIEGGSHMLPITHAERLADLIAEFAR